MSFVFASSGKLFIQLRNGSSCALFFSADDVYPAKLHPPAAIHRFEARS